MTIIPYLMVGMDGHHGRNENVTLQVVSGSPLTVENPHYLRVHTTKPRCGFANKAYDGLYIEQGKEYKIVFYARSVEYTGAFQILAEKDGEIGAKVQIDSVPSKEDGNFWNRYEATLMAEKTMRHARFVLQMQECGIVKFDFISMMPADAVEGIFRKDLFQKLADTKTGIFTFPRRMYHRRKYMGKPLSV